MLEFCIQHKEKMTKMNDSNEIILGQLKDLIDKNGPDFLKDKPHAVYKALVEANPENTVTAGAILMLLASGIWDSVKLINDCGEISGKIQKDCCFNKKMSERLANIILALYSKDNKAEWKKKKDDGLECFLAQEQTFRWEGYACWDAGNCTMDCYYDADITLKPTKEAGLNKDLQKMMKKNPFLSEEAIYKFYEKALDEYLNREFEEYCTCDDYYEPVVEDFELESYVESWCKKNGFKIISCEGEGRDGGYEPKFKRGWY